MQRRFYINFNVLKFERKFALAAIINCLMYLVFEFTITSKTVEEKTKIIVHKKKRCTNVILYVNKYNS